MLLNAMTLLCELGIICATFIFLRNELAWQKLLEDAGRPEKSKEKLIMLSLSLVATGSVILLTIVGAGNISIGLKHAWNRTKKLTKMATSIFPTKIHDRASMVFQHPQDIKLGSTREEQAPEQQMSGMEDKKHQMEHTAAITLH
jgi:hypothetical protein